MPRFNVPVTATTQLEIQVVADDEDEAERVVIAQLERDGWRPADEIDGPFFEADVPEPVPADEDDEDETV